MEVYKNRNIILWERGNQNVARAPPRELINKARHVLAHELSSSCEPTNGALLTRGHELSWHKQLMLPYEISIQFEAS